jgi:hypothetical protein
MAQNEFHCAGMDARDVLNTIVEQGANLALPRDAVFYFYGPEAKLPALEADLERLGFSVRPTKTEPGRIATIKTVLDEAWLRQVMPRAGPP